MSILERITGRAKPTAPPLPEPLSERDRIGAEIEYETSQLPEMEALVRIGRREQKDLDRKRALIAGLQNTLAALDAKAIEEERRRTELPKLEAQLRELLADVIPQVVALRDKIQAIRALRKQIDQFGSCLHVGPLYVKGASHEVLGLASTDTLRFNFLGAFVGPANTLDRWLKAANKLGLYGTPEPEQPKRVDPRDLMTAEERSAIADQQRRRRPNVNVSAADQHMQEIERLRAALQ